MKNMSSRANFKVMNVKQMKYIENIAERLLVIGVESYPWDPVTGQVVKFVVESLPSASEVKGFTLSIAQFFRI